MRARRSNPSNKRISRPLNSDALGEHGESIFRSICSREGLIVNKSERDRTGWDFRVERPNSALDPNQYPDRRQIPLAYNFQIKTMWKENQQFKASLLSIERIAKTLDPSFIFVLRLDDSTNIYDGFLIHLAGQTLDSILETLTKFSNQAQPISQKNKISFRMNDQWTPFFTESMKIIDTIDNICKSYSGHLSYAERKKIQLDTSGYDSLSTLLNVTFSEIEEEDLIDGLLGQRPLPFLNVSTTEVRFGIERPHTFDIKGQGTISITPIEKNNCRIFIRESPHSNPIVRPASLIIPGIMPSTGNFRFLVKSFPLKFDIKLPSHFSLNFDSISLEKQPIKWWRELYEIFYAVTSPGVIFEIYKDTGEKLLKTNPQPSPYFDEITRIQTGRALSLIQTVEDILSRTGQCDERISIDDMTSHETAIVALSHIIDQIGYKYSANLILRRKIDKNLIESPHTAVVIRVQNIGSCKILACSVARATLGKIKKNRCTIDLEVTQQGFLEPGNSMDIKRFAEICSKNSSAKIQIIENDE